MSRPGGRLVGEILGPQSREIKFRRLARGDATQNSLLKVHRSTATEPSPVGQIKGTDSPFTLKEYHQKVTSDTLGLGRT